MNRYFRQGWIGLAAGLASSPALIATQDSALMAIALAAIIGKGFEWLFRCRIRWRMGTHLRLALVVYRSNDLAADIAWWEP